MRRRADPSISLPASPVDQSHRRIALPGHKMKVIALDGNPVPTPQTLDSIFLGTGERADVVIEMNHPGVWILGSTEKMDRLILANSKKAG